MAFFAESLNVLLYVLVKPFLPLLAGETTGDAIFNHTLYVLLAFCQAWVSSKRKMAYIEQYRGRHMNPQ